MLSYCSLHVSPMQNEIMAPYIDTSQDMIDKLCRKELDRISQNAENMMLVNSIHLYVLNQLAAVSRNVSLQLADITRTEQHITQVQLALTTLDEIKTPRIKVDEEKKYLLDICKDYQNFKIIQSNDVYLKSKYKEWNNAVLEIMQPVGQTLPCLVLAHNVNDQYGAVIVDHEHTLQQDLKPFLHKDYTMLVHGMNLLLNWVTEYVICEVCESISSQDIILLSQHTNLISHISEFDKQLLLPSNLTFINDTENKQIPDMTIIKEKHASGILIVTNNLENWKEFIASNSLLE